jgi:hypothetical protein
MQAPIQLFPIRLPDGNLLLTDCDIDIANLIEVIEVDDERAMNSEELFLG